MHTKKKLEGGKERGEGGGEGRLIYSLFSVIVMTNAAIKRVNDINTSSHC